jgi:hypothetical protein
MLVLNRSLLNREYTVINVLKALVLIISMCSLHVTFLSKITLRYFALFINGMFLPFNVRRDSDDRRLSLHVIIRIAAIDSFQIILDSQALKTTFTQYDFVTESQLI